MMNKESRMFNLNGTNLDDTANIKFALTSLGYYDDSHTGLSPYADDQLFHSIQSFQKDKNLKVDGVINPSGETDQEINKSLKKDKKAGNAFKDFKNNFDKMNEANTIGADKYFHCIANYEAASRGWGGAIVAKSLSDLKEVKDKYINKYEDGDEDQQANIFGRKAGKSKKYHSAKAACSLFRPKGLDEKY